MAKIENVMIADLDRNGLQTRAALNEDAVQEYVEAVRAGAKFPPVVAFTDGVKLWLADGFHRVEANQRAGHRKIRADIRPGDFYSALAYAIGANTSHGIRRTNADKRHALQMAWDNRLQLFDNAEPSLQMLADAVGVHVNTVKNFKKEALGEAWSGSTNCTTCETANAENKGAGESPTPPEAPKGEIAVMPPPRRPSVAPQTMPVPPRRMGVDGKSYPVPPRRPSAVPQPLPVAEAASGRPQPPAQPVAAQQPPAAEVEHAPGVVVDRFDAEVPMELADAFTSDILRDWAATVSGLRSAVKSALERRDIAVSKLSQRVPMILDNLYAELKAAIPYCVCRCCQGVDGCKACGGTGFQSEDQFKRNPPEVMPRA